MDNIQLKNLQKQYENLTYFDQYNGSVLLFILITICLILLVSYCLIMINAQPIIDDWPNQRCKPTIMPFAGLITKPEGVSASEYTIENFNYCTQNILSGVTGSALEPVTFVTDILSKMTKQVEDNIQNIRGVFDKVRSSFQQVSEEIMGRVINVTIPLQQIIISFKDLISKIQGTMTAGLYTCLGTHYTLQSLMGAIGQFIVTILIALAAMIAAFWAVPFTWGVAAVNTLIFVAISIPMIIILAFMKDVLKINTGLKIPKVKCFDKNTILEMFDGSCKNIIDIKTGDILKNNNKITACIIVETNGSIMYNLDGIIVSDSHIVKHKNTWLPVSKHPKAIQMDFYNEPYLYCLNTSTKIIEINNYIFTDWDELVEKELNEILKNPFIPIKNISDIHTYLDGGFSGSTMIVCKNGAIKEIQEICVNDILEHGEKVYGIVKIRGSNLKAQIQLNLGNNLCIEGGHNISICDKNLEWSAIFLDGKYKKKLNANHKYLYHLLTDSGSFYIGNVKFYDYNASIDILLAKNRGKLLSMKYV